MIWTDDTPVTVLGGEKPGSHKGRFWVYIGPAAFPYDVYDFTENRKRDGPAQFLANYAGYLQADAFSGYDGIYTGSDGQILEVACWAHARRKFFEARSSSPAEASLILEMIRRLYEVEDRARPLDDDARRALRQAEAVPILERLRDELDRLSSRLLPKSALAQAVTYALNQWQALCRYTEDGRLTIDNNVSERRLRDQAIGRKNWLFLGSDEAGPRAAVLCTIIAGAKRHRLEPWAYLHDVILQLSVDASPESLDAPAAGPLGLGAPRARAEPSPRGVAPEGPATGSASGRAAPLEVERRETTQVMALASPLGPAPARGHLGIPDAYVTTTKPAKLEWSWDRAKYKQALAADGAYLLRSNQDGWTAREFWETYIQLTVVERAFRVLKSELLLRPVWHHYSGRTQAHVMVCVLAYALWKTLDHLARQAGLKTQIRKPDRRSHDRRPNRGR